jgi:hypothetical protein
MGRTTEGSEFESRQGQEFSLLHVVQTGSGVPPTSHPMGTGGSFPGGKAAGVWRCEENVDLYIHSSIRLHGVVLNSLSTGTTLPLPLPLLWQPQIALTSIMYVTIYVSEILHIHDVPEVASTFIFMPVVVILPTDLVAENGAKWPPYIQDNCRLSGKDEGGYWAS